jgi:hypothetical protein
VSGSAEDETRPEPTDAGPRDSEPGPTAAHAEPPDASEPAPEPDEPAPEEPPPPPAGAAREPSLDDLAAQLQAIPIGSFLVSTVSTLASLAYGKLALNQLDEARGAVDAMGALVPLLEGRVDAALKRDFEQALANLRLAYADASAKASS